MKTVILLLSLVAAPAGEAREPEVKARIGAVPKLAILASSGSPCIP